MLANQFGEADGSQVSSLMYAAFVLMIMTLGSQHLRAASR
jgi:phosphate transport system permease protein